MKRLALGPRGPTGSQSLRPWESRRPLDSRPWPGRLEVKADSLPRMEAPWPAGAASNATSPAAIRLFSRIRRIPPRTPRPEPRPSLAVPATSGLSRAASHQVRACQKGDAGHREEKDGSS